MCKHTLTHIIAKKCNFAWKNSEKPWFWRFLVIFVFLTWRHLWRHCGVIQGMFVLFFWYQWTREGHSYPLVPHTWYFINRFPRSWGEQNLSPGCEMGPKSPALLGLTLLQKPHFWSILWLKVDLLADLGGASHPPGYRPESGISELGVFL